MPYDTAQAAFQYGDFKMHKVQIHKFSLGKIGEPVQFGEIIIHGLQKQLFDLAPVKFTGFGAF